MQSQIAMKTALLGLIAAGALGAAATASATPASDAGSSMKCYGVNAAHKNDCQSPGHSCAGQDAKARDPQAFVAVPKGLCAKLAGGSATPGQAMADADHAMMMKK